MNPITHHRGSRKPICITLLSISVLLLTGGCSADFEQLLSSHFGLSTKTQKAAIEVNSVHPNGFINLGMPEEGFVRLYPLADQKGQGMYSRNDRLFGIEGSWTYAFHDGRLSWYSFRAHDSEVSKEQFDRTFAATNNLIDDYIGQYGQPWREDLGFTKYINPEIQSHKGYKVREAMWRIPGGDVSVEFSFLGSGGIYALLLTVQASSNAG